MCQPPPPLAYSASWQAWMCGLPRLVTSSPVSYPLASCYQHGWMRHVQSLQTGLLALMATDTFGRGARLLTRCALHCESA